jgi:hypothetical protein
MPRKLRGSVKAAPIQKTDLHTRGVKRYFFTYAQNNTKVFKAAWDNIQALADHVRADIKVSRGTYDLWTHGERSAKVGRAKGDLRDNVWWDTSLDPYICDDLTEIAKGLVFVGTSNILPTAERPLRGFETLTGRRSSIFPHPKIELECVASGKYEGTKFNYTTGAVTQRNYIQKKVGQKAERLHCYGGLIVEVDATGAWFVRQVQANERGVLCDLDVRVEAGKVTTGNPVEGITWGDAHGVMVDPEVAAISWGEGGMLDQLQPRHQFFEDIFDMRARNHHERGNPHRMFERMVDGMDSVEQETVKTSCLLTDADRDWCRSVVVKSNHDDALERWLAEADYRHDPLNAEFFLEAQREVYRAIRERRQKEFLVIEWALRRAGCPSPVQFLHEDESFILCPDEEGGIECGLHGHRGVNGARGTVTGFARMGRRVNVGDKHVAAIRDGAYFAGTASKFDMGYNKGPSSWSHSHIVTYPTGSRSIVTCWRGKWRA